MSEVYDQLPFDLSRQIVQRADSVTTRQYSTRAASQRGGSTPLSEVTRLRILDEHNWVCQYCGAAASDVDHIIPWTYGGSDDEDNLTASCHLCNMIASNKVFDTFTDKRAFIVEERRKRSMPPPNLCIECGRPFYNGARGATRFMCSQCNHEDLAESKRLRPKRSERRRFVKEINRALKPH